MSRYLFENKKLVTNSDDGTKLPITVGGNWTFFAILDLIAHFADYNRV